VFISDNTKNPQTINVDRKDLNLEKIFYMTTLKNGVLLVESDKETKYYIYDQLQRKFIEFNMETYTSDDSGKFKSQDQQTSYDFHDPNVGSLESVSYQLTPDKQLLEIAIDRNRTAVITAVGSNPISKTFKNFDTEIKTSFEGNNIFSIGNIIGAFGYSHGNNTTEVSEKPKFLFICQTENGTFSLGLNMERDKLIKSLTSWRTSLFYETTLEVIGGSEENNLIIGVITLNNIPWIIVRKRNGIIDLQEKKIDLGNDWEEDNAPKVPIQQKNLSA